MNTLNNEMSTLSFYNNKIGGTTQIPPTPSNPIVDCIRDGTMAYIYLVDESYIQQQQQTTNKRPSLIPLPNTLYTSINSETNTPNISPFKFQQNNEDLSSVKDIYNYLNCFEVQQAKDFHCLDYIKRYARFHLNLTLKFMGCKSIHARQISNTVFEQLEKCRKHVYKQQQMQQVNINNLNLNGTPENAIVTTTSTSTTTTTTLPTTTQPPIYCVSIQRNIFYYIIGHILSCYQYSKPQYIIDFPVSCEVQDKKHSFTILLGGTSGCGKSTLTALLASRIGFTAVISTDNIRQLLRKFISRAESPVLWASTYHAGEIISDPSLSHKEKILQGYEAQNEMIFHKLDVLIGHYEKRKESLIVEGVHLDTRLILRLVKKHPSCIPFLMYISNEAKHKERFAIRSKYMTLDPHQNKYTKYFKNIRIINDYLCHGADEHMIPQIDNTSIDRSLATIHGTIFACLKRKVQCGESYYNHETNKLNMLYNEYEQIQHQFWSSKGMLRLIQKKKTVTPNIHHNSNNNGGVVGGVAANNNNINSSNSVVEVNSNNNNNGNNNINCSNSSSSSSSSCSSSSDGDNNEIINNNSNTNTTTCPNYNGSGSNGSIGGGNNNGSLNNNNNNNNSNSTTTTISNINNDKKEEIEDEIEEVEPVEEEAFNSDDEHDEDDDLIRGSESLNGIKKSSSAVGKKDKTHSREKNQSVSEDSDDDTDSESEGGDRIDYYLDCGSLGS